MIEFDFTKLDVGAIYRLMIDAIVPRPIAFVSTISPEGAVNLAPFSFFNAVSSAPPCLAFSVTGKRDTKKDTLLNIEKTGQFVVNSSNEWMAQAINQCSGEYPYGVDEMKVAGLTPLPSVKVRPPRVAEAAVQMECETHQLVPIGDGGLGAVTLVIGRILTVHVREDIYKDGRISFADYQPLARLGGLSYGRVSHAFDLPRPKV